MTKYEILLIILASAPFLTLIAGAMLNGIAMEDLDDE
jgi:hypothetical protein